MTRTSSTGGGAVGSYPATLYAAVHTGTPGDTEFYLEACHGAGPVLELGCGTGRVGRVLVEAGHEVVGIDRDHDALAIAAGNGIKTLAADFSQFALEQVFDRVIIPYNGFCCLLSQPAMVKCLRSVERHLAPAGLLVFDIFCGDLLAPERENREASDEPELVASINFEDQCWDIFERSAIHHASQRIDATYTHVPRGQGKPIVATICSRYLRSDQVPELLQQANLTLAALHGGFRGESFQPECEHLVVRATRQNS